MKGEGQNPISEPEIKLTLNAYLPDDYIPNSEIKVDIYKKIATISNNEDKDKLVTELKDRFGALPQPVAQLFRAVDLRLLSVKAQVEKIAMQRRKIIVQLASGAQLKIDPRKFLKKFHPQVKLVSSTPPLLEINTADFEDPETISFIEQVLHCFL